MITSSHIIRDFTDATHAETVRSAQKRHLVAQAMDESTSASCWTRLLRAVAHVRTRSATSGTDARATLTGQPLPIVAQAVRGR